MNKFFCAPCFLFLTCKAFAQDFSVSFDVTYKNDFHITNQSAIEVIGNIFDQESKKRIVTDSLKLVTKKTIC